MWSEAAVRPKQMVVLARGSSASVESRFLCLDSCSSARSCRRGEGGSHYRAGAGCSCCPAGDSPPRPAMLRRLLRYFFPLIFRKVVYTPTEYY